MEKSRQQFEAMATKEGLSLEVFNGDYNWLNTRLAWKFWQASRESLEIELPTKEPNPSQDNYYAFGYNRAITESVETLRAQGVNVK